MNRRKKWDLGGPVRTCEVQRTWVVHRCGEESCEREEARDKSDLEFDRDGALLVHSHLNPDGSQWTVKYRYEYESGRLVAIHGIEENSATVVRNEYDGEGRLRRVINEPANVSRVTEDYDYDLEGRKRKTQYMDDQQPGVRRLWSVEGTDSYYSAAGTNKVATVYSERDQPAELLFYDASNHPIKRVEFTYDADGNLIEELQSQPPEAFASMFANLPQDQLAAAAQMMLSIAAPIRVTHRYIEGRRVETRTRFGQLGEHIKKRTYNERGDPVTETSEDRSREYAGNEKGDLRPVVSSERVQHSEARFVYEYDEYSNWTSKIVEVRSDGGEDFTPSSVEKRIIRYFDAD